MVDADSRPTFTELYIEFFKMSKDPGRYLVIPVKLLHVYTTLSFCCITCRDVNLLRFRGRLAARPKKTTITIIITYSVTARKTKKFAERPHRMPCCYWRLNDPFSLQALLTTVTPLERLPVLFSGPDNPKIAHFPRGIWTPSNTCFLGSTRVSPPNGT